MFTKNGKHIIFPTHQIIFPTHVNKVKILYHILKAKVKFSVIGYWLSSLFANYRCTC